MGPSSAFPRVLAALLSVAALQLGAADPAVTATPKAPAVLKGTLAPGKEASWRVTFQGGQKARLRITQGQRGVTADLFDPEGLTANEGVSEEDWFPVSAGNYKVTVTNVTALGKAAGQTVAYEVRIEVR